MKRCLLILLSLLLLTGTSLSAAVHYDGALSITLNGVGAINANSRDKNFRYAFDLALDADLLSMKVGDNRLSLPLVFEYQTPSNIVMRRQITELMRFKGGLSYSYEFEYLSIGVMGHVGFEYFPKQRATSWMWDVGLNLLFPLGSYFNIGVPFTFQVDNQLYTIELGVVMRVDFMGERR